MDNPEYLVDGPGICCLEATFGGLIPVPGGLKPVVGSVEAGLRRPVWGIPEVPGGGKADEGAAILKIK